jgi:hypothetical protein
MRSVFRVFVGATVLAGGMSAVAQTSFRSADVEAIPTAGVKTYTAHPVAYKHNGRIFRNNGTQTTRGTTVAFDNQSAPAIDPNVGINWALGSADLDPNLPGNQIDLLCHYPVSQDAFFFTAIRLGDQDCPAAAQSVSNTALSDPEDIVFDKYLMEGAGDPNDTVTITGLSKTVYNLGAHVGVLEMKYGFLEASDTNSNGEIDQIDEVSAYYILPSVGVWILSWDADPNDTPVQALVRGQRTHDMGNELLDPNDLVTSLAPACNFYHIFVGGNTQNIFDWDPNCATPQDLVTAGTVDEPNIIFVNGRDNWMWFSDTEGATLDPNVPVDPGFDGDAGSTSYEDIWNTGFFNIWVFSFVGGNGLDMALDYMNIMTIPAAAPACSGDVNGDGSTNITDLGILLANFGTAVPPGTLGDLDGSGTVNITDLGILLADFGCTP